MTTQQTNNQEDTQTQWLQVKKAIREDVRDESGVIKRWQERVKLPLNTIAHLYRSTGGDVVVSESDDRNVITIEIKQPRVDVKKFKIEQSNHLISLSTDDNNNEKWVLTTQSVDDNVLVLIFFMFGAVGIQYYEQVRDQVRYVEQRISETSAAGSVIKKSGTL